jgi:SSS family solute:Na+ symporter
MQEPGLHVLDVLVVLAYLATIVGIGAYFARKQTSTDAYFAGGRSVPAWAVGFSVMATSISSVTFLAYPGEGFAGNWIRLVQGLMLPVVLVFFIWWLVPLYRHVIRLSAYEYFEKRFGYGARLYSSLAFTLMHFSKMGTVFFLLALALAKMTGFNTYHVVLVIATLTVAYTLVGGIEAVIWSDVMQSIVLVAGGLICIGVLLFAPEASPGTILSNAWAQGKMSLSHPDPNVSQLDFVNLTTLVMAMNGIFWSVQKYGTDQAVVQRFLVAKTDRGAIKAVFGGALFCVPVWTLFMFIGTLLSSFYQTTPLPEGTRADAVFPWFIMTQLPPGVTGIILAALVAAAMSSLDSDLNCLAAVGVEDYYRRFRPQATDKQCLNIGRWIVVVSGVFATAVAMGYIAAEGKNALAVVFSLYAIFSGGITGLFALAFFTRRTNRAGVYTGIAACVLFTAYAVLTSKSFQLGDVTIHINLGRWNFTHHSYMIGVYSHIVLFVVGYVASLFFKHEPRAEELTYWGWRKRRAAARADAS